MGEPKIETELLWCNTCKRTFPLYFIRFSETRWAMINPHEHPLTVGICPRTVWKTIDLKEEKFPELIELFKLCEDISKRKQALEVFDALAKLEKERLGRMWGIE